jgi:hypothetical protein
MSVDTDRRSGFDRRQQTGINVRLLVGNGSRTVIRREEDRGHIFLVDQYGPVLFLTIVAILFLCVIDAILALYLMNHGAYETTPLMALLLNQGPWAFFIFKYGLTIIATFCLLMFRCVVVQKLNVSTHTILHLLAWVYAAVVGWELYLVYHVA